MRCNVISDLHLEFADLELPGGDVLILGGDVCEAKNIKLSEYNRDLVTSDRARRPDRYARFFIEECAKYRKVIYIMGNHEHYHGDFATSGNKLKSLLESNMLSNVYLLDKETKKIDDVTFVGGTLWTDMNREDPLTLFHISRMMNDFRCVENSNRMIERKVQIYELNPDWTEDGKIVCAHNSFADFIDGQFFNIVLDYINGKKL